MSKKGGGGHHFSWQKIEKADNYGRQLSIEKQTPCSTYLQQFLIFYTLKYD
jgi:hypothetical protein